MSPYDVDERGIVTCTLDGCGGEMEHKSGFYECKRCGQRFYGEPGAKPPVVICGKCGDRHYRGSQGAQCPVCGFPDAESERIQ